MGKTCELPVCPPSATWEGLALQQAFRRLVQRLRTGGIEEAPLEAWLLLEGVLETPRERLLLDLDRPLTRDAAVRLEVLLSRRLRREPLAHILECREFWGLSFWTPPGVFIPRPETECLVETLLVALRQEAPKVPRQILDLGTGSGCLAGVLAKEFPRAQVLGVDCSLRALVVARQNAQRHGVAHRIQWIQGDWATAFREARRWDVVVSNPPYVSQEAWARLEPEVRSFEPPEALLGGADGLEAYRQLLPQVACRLRPGGWLLLEIGWDQGAVISRWIQEMEGFDSPRVIQDLSGRERGILCRYKG